MEQNNDLSISAYLRFSLGDNNESSSVEMNATRWLMTGKERILLDQFKFQPSLGPREIAVRTEFTAVSPGTECAHFLAMDPDNLRPGTWCSYPYTPGYAGIGEVIGTGSAVTGYRPGDRVVGRMPHASHCVCNVDEALAPAVPAVKPEHAAYSRLVSISYTALQVIDARPFQTAAVWGLGLIGNLVAQVLQNAGFRVTGIDPVPERRAMAEACGIRITEPPPVAESGPEYDVTVDCIGDAATTLAMPRYTRKRGQMVLMTHWRNQPPMDATAFITAIFRRGIRLFGAHEIAVGGEPFHDWGALAGRKLAVIQEEIASGKLNLGPLISHVVRPSQCGEAFEGLCHDKARWWGVVVDWRTQSKSSQ